jgi:hypothetical protein
MRIKSLNISIKRPSNKNPIWSNKSNEYDYSTIRYWDLVNNFVSIKLPIKCTSLNTNYIIKDKSHFSILILTKRLYYDNN